MSESNVAVLFSGQGKPCAETLFSPAGMRPRLLEICGEIGGTRGSQLAWSVGALASAAPGRRTTMLSAMSHDETAFLVYIVSIGAYRCLSHSGWTPRALLGLGFGEIPALVCAGAFTVAQGAEIVSARNQALKCLNPGAGYMATIRAGSETVSAMIAALGSRDMAIAVESSDEETVVAGSRETFQRIFAAAARRGIRFSSLSSSYPIHCAPMMSAVSYSMYRALQGVTAQRLRVPVFSAVKGTFLDAPAEGSTDLIGYLCESMRRPIRFADALRQLRDLGINQVVDCSLLEGSSRHLRRVFGEPCWHVLADRVSPQQFSEFSPLCLLAQSA